MTQIFTTVHDIHAKSTAHGCLTSGMVGVPVRFEYSDIWGSLHKTAVFTAGGVTRDVVDISDTCTVPSEVLAKAGTILYVGVYGWRDDGTIVIPTIMAPVGMIIPGADPSGDEGTDPDLPVWAQLQAAIEELRENAGADPDVVRQIVADYLATDADVVTKATKDLENYYLKSQTYERNEIDQLVSRIPKFGLQVVATLPTTDISDTTIYLVPGGNGSDLYTEYIHINGAWEVLGSQRVDLTGYATEEWVTALLGGKLDADRLPEAIDTALAQAKASGTFDGKDGEPGPPGVSGVYVGSGDMPDGYNIQIDPDGDADDAIKEMVDDALTKVPAGLTAAQINALDGMFTVCAFAVDPTEAYAAFRAAFGLSDSGSDTPDIPDVPDEPDEPEVKVYTVTNNLTNVTNSNSATTVSSYYSATLSTETGYVMTVTITMGGVDITESVYTADGTILITEVTGDIVITATAELATAPVLYQLANTPRTVNADLFEDTGLAFGTPTANGYTRAWTMVARVKNVTAGALWSVNSVGNFCGQYDKSWFAEASNNMVGIAMKICAAAYTARGTAANLDEICFVITHEAMSVKTVKIHGLSYATGEVVTSELVGTYGNFYYSGYAGNMMVGGMSAADFAGTIEEFTIYEGVATEDQIKSYLGVA